ncbi:MAG TPA: glycine cleavage system protein H, partial [Planctomycetes bacterium]|nr:glycine cleavage system protein H [Planctomycetota bacterium]
MPPSRSTSAARDRPSSATPSPTTVDPAADPGPLSSPLPSCRRRHGRSYFALSHGDVAVGSGCGSWRGRSSEGSPPPMAKVPEDRRYLSSHEWALPEDGVVVVGISEFAAEELGELVYIDLPNLGSAVTARENFGEIESVKAVSELNSPISGKVVAVNVDLVDRLELISKSSYEEGWMI